MVRTLRLMAVGVALAAGLSAMGSAQQRPGTASGTASNGDQTQTPAETTASQTPTFRGGIDFVRVDVIITDKSGNTVSDLKPEDFEVTEDGKPQKIETFKLIELNGGLTPGAEGPPRAIRTDSDEESEAAREDVRLFGIFLDDYHVRAGASMSARQQIARFIETQLGPSDMVGVMYPLAPLDTVRFTRNHEAISQAIQQFLGRKFDYTPRNTIEDGYVHRYPAEIVERIRNQVSLSAIEGLIIRMGRLKEGRKALILVSEGYSNMLPPQLRSSIATMDPRMDPFNPAAGDPLAGTNSPIEDRAAFFASVDLQTDLREIFTAASRNNVAIYTVDPRGLATNEFGIDENVGLQLDRNYLNSTLDTLRQLAEATDGRAIVSRNDITVAMKQIVKDTSAYYLLGYTSTVAPSDGKFHEIKVRVKRPGIQVRSRKGYWALTASDVQRVLAPPKPAPPTGVSTTLAAIAPPKNRLVQTWIGTERGQNGKTKVTFVWEPTPSTPGERSRSTDRPARVSLTAIGVDGAPLFRGRVPDTTTPAPAAAATDGSAAAAAPSKLTFELPPGKVQIRMAVEGTGAETLDSEVREITVPDLTAPQTFIGTPSVFRARTAREAQTIKSDAEAVPTAGREFRRSDRLLLKVPIHGPGVQAPTVTARLLNRTGQPISDLPVATPPASNQALVEVALAALAPTEYVIEVTVTGAGSDAKELVGFRVTS